MKMENERLCIEISEHGADRSAIGTNIVGRS